MKCTSRKSISLLILITALLLSACANRSPAMAYQVNNELSAFRMFKISDEVPQARTFAADLAVVRANYFSEADQEVMEAGGAMLIGTNDKTVLYAKDVYERRHPASLTKIMTALVALKYGQLDTIVTVSSNVNVIESGAQVSGLNPGDQLSMAQALHISLINSANDAAIVVAEAVAGTVDEFVALMNREARALGATNTNFVNPHGLSHDDQYTTVYDMYLITNAVIKYEAFNQIIQLSSYTTSYTTANGETREITINNTNQYLQGGHTAPERITVIGGKTGTTSAARHCLVNIAKDAVGNSYMSVIMFAETRDLVYEQTNELLRLIN